MTAISVVVWMLAVNQIIEIWRHSENEFVAAPREWMQMQLDRDLTFWLVGVYRAALCPWCCSVWVAMGALLTVYFGQEWILWPFGISRAANLINDLTHAFNRTPKSGEGVLLDP